MRAAVLALSLFQNPHDLGFTKSANLHPKSPRRSRRENSTLKPDYFQGGLPSLLAAAGATLWVGRSSGSLNGGAIPLRDIRGRSPKTAPIRE
jgi:hypothetical protein